MFDSATLNLFIAITAFVVITVAGRDLLAGRSVGGSVLSKAVAQFVAGMVGIAAAVAYLLAVG